MKKRDLKRKLNIYADSFERKGYILWAAYHEMDLKYASGIRVRNRRVFNKRLAFGLVAAAIFFIVVIGVALNDLGIFGSKVKSYSLNTLQKESVAENEFLQLTGVMYLNGEPDNTDGRFYIYSDKKNKTFVAKAVYRTIRNDCVDEITIISDLKGGLADYKLKKPSKNNPMIREFDTNEMGEYYSDFSVLRNNITYYIMITSPVSGAGAYYENILL